MESQHNHHILFPRKLWRAQEPTLRLRETQWLKPPLDDEVHAELHKEIPLVPAPSFAMAERIYNSFVPVLFDHVGSLENLIRAVEASSRHPSVNSLEHELGQLMIASLLSQRSFVIEGLITPDREPSVA